MTQSLNTQVDSLNEDLNASEVGCDGVKLFDKCLELWRTIACRCLRQLSLVEFDQTCP